MTSWGKNIKVDMLPEITTADRDMIYILPDGTDWLSSYNWCANGQVPIWRPVPWAFGIPCNRCGGTGSCETELGLGLVRCPNCIPDPVYVTNLQKDEPND